VGVEAGLAHMTIVPVSTTGPVGRVTYLLASRQT
jgi:hypothetical protein